MHHLVGRSGVQIQVAEFGTSRLNLAQRIQLRNTDDSLMDTRYSSGTLVNLQCSIGQPYPEVFFSESHRYTPEIPEPVPSLSGHGARIGSLILFLVIK